MQKFSIYSEIPNPNGLETRRGATILGFKRVEDGKSTLGPDSMITPLMESACLSPRHNFEVVRLNCAAALLNRVSRFARFFFHQKRGLEDLLFVARNVRATGFSQMRVEIVGQRFPHTVDSGSDAIRRTLTVGLRIERGAILRNPSLFCVGQGFNTPQIDDHEKRTVGSLYLVPMR